MTVIRVSLEQGDALRQGEAKLIDSWRGDSDDKLWVDIQDPAQDVLEPLLEQRFGFHELAAEDSMSLNTLPKYDAFPDYDFFIFRAVDVNLNAHGSQTYKLAAFASVIWAAIGFSFAMVRLGADAPVTGWIDLLARPTTFCKCSSVQFGYASPVVGISKG